MVNRRVIDRGLVENSDNISVKSKVVLIDNHNMVAIMINLMIKILATLPRPKIYRDNKSTRRSLTMLTDMIIHHQCIIEMITSKIEALV